MEVAEIEGKNDNPRIDRFTLANGARVICEDVPWVESVSIGLFLRVGSIYESKKLNGISHFLEHMVFKGTRKRSSMAIVMDIESLGGVINAATSKEFTNFYARIYHKHLPRALDVLCDLVYQPKLPAKDLEREKYVVIEEIKMGEDNPDEFIIDKFYSSVYGDTSLGRNIAGREASVSSFTMKDIVDYHANHYVPRNMVISISGNLEGKDIRSLLERSFRSAGVWKKAKPRRSGPTSKADFKPARFVAHKDVEQTTLLIGYPSVSVFDPDRYAFAVVDAYLSGGMSSRLFQEVREKRGLVYSIDSNQAPMSKHGLYTIEAGMASGNAPQVAKLVARELNRIREKGIPAKGFKNAREYIKGVMLLGLESSTARMSRNAMGELFHGRYLPTKELIRNLDAVTHDDVQRVAKRVFKPMNAAIGLLTAENGKAGDRILLKSVKDEVVG